jgi:hypothetical protein
MVPFGPKFVWRTSMRPRAALMLSCKAWPRRATSAFGFASWTAADDLFEAWHFCFRWAFPSLNSHSRNSHFLKKINSRNPFVFCFLWKFSIARLGIFMILFFGNVWFLSHSNVWFLSHSNALVIIYATWDSSKNVTLRWWILSNGQLPSYFICSFSCF